VPLPEPHPFCNDIAVDAGGSVYVTDSANPTVLRLPAGASGFEVFATNPQSRRRSRTAPGSTGSPSAATARLYVTTYAAGGFFRIAVKKGPAGPVIKLQGQALGLPDGLRPLVGTASCWSRALGPWIGSKSTATCSGLRPCAPGSHANLGHPGGVRRLGQRRPDAALLRPRSQGRVTRPAVPDLRRSP